MRMRAKERRDKGLHVYLWEVPKWKWKIYRDLCTEFYKKPVREVLMEDFV